MSSNPIGGPIDPKAIVGATSTNKAKEASFSNPVAGESEIANQASPTTVKNVVKAVEKLFPGLSKGAKDLLANKTLGIDDNGPQNITNA